MQQAIFEGHMLTRGLADRTRSQRGYALKRIERAYGVDLDAEYERDQLASVLHSMTYSVSDERTGRPNPSRLDIDPDKLLTHLRWYKSHVVDYARFKGGMPEIESADVDLVTDASADALVEEAIGRTFALERDLQAALRGDLAQLEDGLAAADGGAERRVEAGFIDILARDRQGILTIVELKAEVTRPEAVAQVLAYMGCIAEETREPVRGILIGSDHHPRVVFAARAIPNLQLRRYRFRFEFN